MKQLNSNKLLFKLKTSNKTFNMFNRFLNLTINISNPITPKIWFPNTIIKWFNQKLFNQINLNK